MNKLLISGPYCRFCRGLHGVCTSDGLLELDGRQRRQERCSAAAVRALSAPSLLWPSTYLPHRPHGRPLLTVTYSRALYGTQVRAHCTTPFREQRPDRSSLLQILRFRAGTCAQRELCMADEPHLYHARRRHRRQVRRLSVPGLPLSARSPCRRARNSRIGRFPMPAEGRSLSNAVQAGRHACLLLGRRIGLLYNSRSLQRADSAWRYQTPNPNVLALVSTWYLHSEHPTRPTAHILRVNSPTS